MSERISKIMQEAVTLSRETFGETLRQVWLFGSYVRGDVDEDSDLDFMVVLSEPVETWRLIDNVFSGFSVDILNRYDEVPSVIYHR